MPRVSKAAFMICAAASAGADGKLHNCCDDDDEDGEEDGGGDSDGDGDGDGVLPPLGRGTQSGSTFVLTTVAIVAVCPG